MPNKRFLLEDEMVAQGMSFHYVKQIIDNYRDEVIDSVIDRVFGTDPSSQHVKAVDNLKDQCKEWIA